MDNSAGKSSIESDKPKPVSYALDDAIHGSFKYDGFLSYSSRSDYGTARRIESFLESFHKVAGRTASIQPLQICRNGSDFHLRRKHMPEETAKDVVLEAVEKELSNSKVLQPADGMRVARKLAALPVATSVFQQLRSSV